MWGEAGVVSGCDKGRQKLSLCFGQQSRCLAWTWGQETLCLSRSAGQVSGCDKGRKPQICCPCSGQVSGSDKGRKPQSCCPCSGQISGCDKGCTPQICCPCSGQVSGCDKGCTPQSCCPCSGQISGCDMARNRMKQDTPIGVTFESNVQLTNVNFVKTQSEN
jgi:hypothetical protein